MKTIRNSKSEVEVYAHWAGLANPMLMGVLSAVPGRGKEIFSFEYDPQWIDSGNAQVLDPALNLYKGPQYVPNGQDNFGLFLDSSPDRWGRFLMNRRETQLAREEKRDPKQLLESDYLLGVYDGHRMGGLRFKKSSHDPFLDDNRNLASPPWTSLRELEKASFELEKEDAENNPDYKKWLMMLLAPGGSLGGARPKVGVVDELGSLWIAKFPSRTDLEDKGAWEAVVHELAGSAGIIIPEAQAKIFTGKHHTFLTKRFDRSPSGERIHFASAMTLLQKKDGDDASTGVSYLDLAEIIAKGGAHPKKDLEQLWRRIVFFVCVSNIDDHLRNHGFLLTPNGWALSPCYDMNPSTEGEGLKLNISDSDNSQDLDLVLEVATFFRITPSDSEKIMDEVVSAVKKWREVASKYKISNSEQDRMSSAFRLVERSVS